MLFCPDKMEQTDLGPAAIKYRIKKSLLFILSKHRSGSKLIMMLRSGRKAVASSAWEPDAKRIGTDEIDLMTLAATIEQAQIAHKKGQHRLALLLAHQCDCMSKEFLDPGLAELLAELKAERTATS
jgi:hypothetical protein